ncbi:CapA family protein [Desulfosporosinus sp. Sb-LF]|uniref:CapA family protein n=1 Tax=Desulfosporosinus sp. Sb-LF TaxID=2560027 RepID=UPI00107F309E|nr:CapA family protein [Desulfosporosinus sp. Sb-LF]TGE32171.1 D-Ala-D-Ala dipeptidase [Desulfosporosinus sp. Sb-LF]
MSNRFLAIIFIFLFLLGLTTPVRADTPIQCITYNISATQSIDANEPTKKTDFVNIQQVVPSAKLDMKYATTDNFTRKKLYDSANALLRRGSADKLKKVADEAAKDGFLLKIWDAYRSPKAQFKMWNFVPNSNYVANPYKGYSNHSRGSAIDLTLVDLNGNEITMPTGFDNFTVAAERANENANAKYLEKIMVKNGFKPLSTEWWHFDDTETYEPADSAQVAVFDGSGKQDIVISAIGDVTLGQDERFLYAGSFNQYYNKYGASYFFERVKKILSEDDLTIANLEGTLTEEKGKPDKRFQGNQAFFFKGSPSYTSILKDGSIEAVNLANNHSMDYLDKGFDDTKAALDKTSITNFGYSKTAVYEKDGINIGLIGVNTLGKIEEGVNLVNLELDLANKIRTLDEKTSLIVVSFHWGTENISTPTSEQRELGRFAVDQGADLVLGHHPHIIQPSEVYQGKYIVYSLGNFVFGGNSNPTQKNTEIFRQIYSFKNGKLVEVNSPLIIPCRLTSGFKPEPCE